MHSPSEWWPELGPKWEQSSTPKPLYPTANVAMGLRMMKDMTFDATPAIEDFGWNPRRFSPVFDQDGAGVSAGLRLRS